MPECYVRGNTIKYLRVPDEVFFNSLFQLSIVDDLHSMDANCEARVIFLELLSIDFLLRPMMILYLVGNLQTTHLSVLEVSDFLEE